MQKPADALRPVKEENVQGIPCSQCNEPTDRKKLYVCTDPTHMEGKQQASSSSASEAIYWNVDEV